MGARIVPPVVDRRHRQRRRADRWRTFLLDWHNGATVIVSVLSAALLIGIISTASDRANAHRDARTAISALERKDRKIDALTGRIDDLDNALAALHEDRATDRAELARLTAERDALQQQVVNLRRRPVVPITVPATTTTTRRPATTTTVRTAGTTTTTRATTTTTTRPATTTTTRCLLRPIRQCSKGGFR